MLDEKNSEYNQVSMENEFLNLLILSSDLNI